MRALVDKVHISHCPGTIDGGFSGTRIWTVGLQLLITAVDSELPKLWDKLHPGVVLTEFGVGNDAPRE